MSDNGLPSDSPDRRRANRWTDRESRLRDLYDAGLTYGEIGRRLGVSGERVRQLIDEYGIPKAPLTERRYHATVRERARELEDLFLQLRSDEEVARSAGVDLSIVRRLIDERVPDAAILRRRPKNVADRYSDAELIDCLGLAARELPSPMAHAAYAEWATGRQLDDGRPWPGPQAAMLRFGGWRAAMARVGLPTNPTAGPRRTFELEDCVKAVVDAWREIGRAPTVSSYDSWRAGRAGIPSSPTARNLVDSWDDLLIAAYPLVHGRKVADVGGRLAASLLAAAGVDGDDGGNGAGTVGRGNGDPEPALAPAAKRER